jgi:hypothetical protein
VIRERNIGIAYILWLIFGLFGAHKLYLRRPVMAVVYLFTLGLFLIGWVVDLFTMNEQVDQCNDKIFESEGLDEQMEDRIDELEDEVEELRDRLRNQ